jgi:hypothetical protein
MGTVSVPVITGSGDHPMRHSVAFAAAAALACQIGKTRPTLGPQRVTLARKTGPKHARSP